MKKLSCEKRASSLSGRHVLPVGLFLIGLMACLAIGVSTAQAQSYSVTDLGVVKGMSASEPAAINNQGHVAGTSTAGEHGCAFLYSNNTMKDVGGLGSRGLGVSPFGVVVGDAWLPGQPGPGLFSHAAVFKNGGPLDLGVLEGYVCSRANGINATGQVVGFSGPQRDGDNSRAFIWTTNTGMIDIGTLGGVYAQANAINDAGFVTGTASLPDMSESTHAFIYQPLSKTERYTERMRDLGTLGGNSSYGMSINAANHVVGYSTINKSDDRAHAFFFDGTKMNDLGSLGRGLGSDYSAALGINNSDQVVGYSYRLAGAQDAVQQVAFVWSRGTKAVGQMINLNTLIGPAGQNYWLLSATAINDSGQIAACAYDYSTNSVHGVLLTPTAPPLVR